MTSNELVTFQPTGKGSFFMENFEIVLEGSFIIEC